MKWQASTALLSFLFDLRVSLFDSLFFLFRIVGDWSADYNGDRTAADIVSFVQSQLAAQRLLRAIATPQPQAEEQVFEVTAEGERGPA